MTLLASERSLLIRNKFRSVLQLRIQNRRQQNEINSDSGLKPSCHAKVGEKEQSDAVRQTDDGATQKSPPCGLTAETAQERSGCGGGQRQKKARLADDLSDKIQRRPGPIELLQKHILPLENTSISFPLSSDVFEDDISCSSSSSPEQLGMHRSPGFSSSPGLGGDQSLSDLSPVATPLNHSPNNIQCSLALLPATEGISQPMTMTVAESNSMATTGRPKGMYMTSQATPLLPKTAQPPTPPPHSILGLSLAPSRPPRPRKARDSKPKMRKLKYHQYIPPDQRGGTGGAVGNSSAQRNATPALPIDPAYSRLLQQQQVFLQLQILNQQQQHTVATSGDNQLVRFSGATPQNCPQPLPVTTNHIPMDTSPTHKPELLPPNLDDLTVSELRQQLRKRGLPVSGTKPALLERLRPFQLPRPCLTPAPLCQLGSTLDPHPANLPLNPPNSDPASNPGHMYIQPPGVGPNVAEQGYLTSPSPSSGSSPSLQASSPLSSSGPWRCEQAAEELSVELEMRERMRSRPRERARDTGSESCGSSLHPFLQQDPGCSRGKAEADGQAEVLFTQVFCCQPCDVIGQDFELPMQITASPVQAPPSVRSLEEELQEAIQRVQMAPNQSIDDILEETIGCSDYVPLVLNIQSTVTALSGSSPASQTDQSQPSQRHSKDDNFLSSPLCSSLLLELPPSPSSTLVLAPALPPPPPPSICTTPPPIIASRKRREVATFDPADWLESLTSGLRPLTPPAAPFVETDFGLDSDLNVNRVLDLMVEQW